MEKRKSHVFLIYDVNSYHVRMNELSSLLLVGYLENESSDPQYYYIKTIKRSIGVLKENSDRANEQQKEL
jgi:hypothetical protein